MKADMSPQALSKAELLTGLFPSAVQHACQCQSHMAHCLAMIHNIRKRLVKPLRITC